MVEEMALAKFYEDIIDDYTDKIPLGYTPVILPQTEPEYYKDKYIDCIYRFCNKQFKNYSELQHHLLNHHNIIFYIKIDEIIADEITLCNFLPKKIELNNSSSSDSIEVQVKFDDISKIHKLIDPASSIVISSKDITEGKYEIILPQLNQQFIIYLNQIPDFNSDDVDPILNRYISLYQINKKKLSVDDRGWDIFWRDFLNETQSHNDFYKQKYLRGFFEYLLGLYLEEKDNELSKEHFENSFGQLRLFKNKSSVTVLRALAFKMNFFNLLRRSPKQSIFYGSNLFFNNTYEDLKKILKATPYKGVFEEEILQDIILLDLNNSLLVKAIHNYLLNDFAQTEFVIEEIMKLTSIDNTLFKLKFNLLRARLKRDQKKHSEAKIIYNELFYFIEENNLINREVKEYTT